MEEQSAGPTFWDDQNTARKVIDRINAIKNQLEPLAKLEEDVENFMVLGEIAQHDNDLATWKEVEKEYHTLSASLADFELRVLLSGEYDKSGAFVTIHSGAGGTEACDWADMLLRMFTRYCERSG